MIDYNLLARTDPEVAAAIRGEATREHNTLEMIASENFVSYAVLAAMGSVMTNKYAEGYPGKRYYGGCEEVDKVEELARERVKALFGADHANVQPHSGTQANMAAYFALLAAGDKLMGLSLSHGGHLSHGHPVNFSGMYFQVVHYEVDPQTRALNYDKLEEHVLAEKPKLLVAGASAYARTLDFPRLRRIADKAGCLLMVDMAHIAGLIAAGLHPNPVPYADVVTSTTHKTLRGPRGGFILCKTEHAEKIDKMTFPGTQGGPFMHIIAAKAVCFKEAASDEFKAYARQILANARALSQRLMEKGFDVVSGGTDTHLFLLDLTTKGLSGKKAEKALEDAGITVNKNTVPFDTRKPYIASGLRIGTPAVTTRGMGPDEMVQIAELIDRVLRLDEDSEDTAKLAAFNAGIEAVKAEVHALTSRFPLY